MILHFDILKACINMMSKKNAMTYLWLFESPNLSLDSSHVALIGDEVQVENFSPLSLEPPIGHPDTVVLSDPKIRSRRS